LIFLRFGLLRLLFELQFLLLQLNKRVLSLLLGLLLSRLFVV
jgi:hypothetical protein